MAYSSGMLKKRIRIARRAEEQGSTFGKSGQPKYQWLGWFWAAETWNKGAKSLQEGALDAYDTVMFRMRFNADVDRWCLVWFNGKFYQINNLQEDKQDNQLQILATEMPNQSVTIVEPYSGSGISGGSRNTQIIGA